jgi:hypothetical protein
VALALAAGLALRLWMLGQFFEVNGDTLVYGGLAKNLLLHGRYALTGWRRDAPTLIRLPGYPLFLALCFRLFGMETTPRRPGCRLRWSWPAACCWPILCGALPRSRAAHARCGWRRFAPSRLSMR